MKQRTFNLAWPLMALIAALLIEESVWGFGAQLFENPATQKSYPNKTVAGYLGVQSGGMVEVQTGPLPTEGQVLIAGCGTSATTSTAIATCAKFGAAASGLPSGTPGQVAGIVALTATRTVVVTGSQTSIGTQTYSYTQSVTGTTTGTVTNTGTSTGTITGTGATGTATLTATGTTTGLYTSGEVSVLSFPMGVALYDSTLYLAALNSTRFQTINVSNPSSMSVLNSYSTCGYPRDVAAWYSGVVVGCGDTHAELWSCTDPSSCTRTQDFTSLDDSAKQVATWGSYALIANSTDDSLQVLNLDNRTVQGKATVSGCGGSGVAAISSGLAALSCGGNGRVYVVDYSTPSSPTTKGYISANAPKGLYSWGGKYVAVADNGANKILVMDATTDPNNPSEIGSVDTGSSTGPYMVTGSGAYLYSTMYSSGELKVISVATPASPSVVGTVSVGSGPIGVASNGTWAFVALSGNNKVKSVNVSRFQTTTGTQTTTNTMTMTGTVTNTQTGTNTLTNTVTGVATGTQTVGNTSVYTSASTGIGTGTATGWEAIYAPTSSGLGNYYLFVHNCEGDCFNARKLDDLNNLGGFPIYQIENKTWSAPCSAGSDGLIGDFLHDVGREPWPVWPGGMWAAHIKASSTGDAAIRVEVWDSVDGQLFNIVTPSFNSPGPSDIYAATAQSSRRPSTTGNKLHFKLYAVCSSPASVSFYSDDLFQSWIESPMHSDRQDSTNVYHPNGTTVYAELNRLAGLPVGTRSVFLDAFQFANSESLATGSRGTGDTYARYLVMPDGSNSGVHSYYWRVPADYTTADYRAGAVLFRPLWVPLATDANYNHRVTWEIRFADVTSGDAAKAGTLIYWDGDTSWSHTGTDGFLSTYSILESGGSYTVPGSVIRVSVKRGHSHGGDTYVGDVGFMGLQIDYPSIL